MSYHLRKWNERKKNGPCPVVDKLYYLPYVKDNEPVAAIMKKFEMMENIRKKEEDEKETNSSKVTREQEDLYGDDGALGEESLHELYRKIGTVMDDPQEEKAELGDDDFQYIEEEDEDDFIYFDDLDDDVMRRHLRYSNAFRYVLSHSRQLVETISPLSVPRKCYRIDEDSTGDVSLHPIGETTVPYPYLYIRVPATIPSTLCRTVLPYTPPNSPTVLYTPDPLRFNFLSLNKQFNVIFFDIPTDFDVLRLRTVHLPRALIAEGFVLIWADYSTLSTLLDLFESKGFFYVENLSMIYPHTEDSPAVWKA
ncbi:uncharacterized protein [Blastocystis hominis]|uniref:Uncharacterized protein n=1 Tax=Blastocystis hominis TaxID=12968 RepID=D8M436_BLAHO|nr:uncharacterized protein [Blastocystis hominis]CBK22825.2 unnamed protein product [Blastocystis hominis]|eukprot:XP_012896873.1 uncharacterized protein [Blastocystis hominis]